MQLVLCLSCARHVRAHETRCPFCDADAFAPPRSNERVARIGRAALLALATTASACGASTGLDWERERRAPAPQDAATASIDAEVPRARDAGPVDIEVDDAGVDSGEGIATLYGSPPADVVFV
jgi:hypothetical protein